MRALISTDLDGTLLRSDLTVSTRTRTLLARLVAEGVELVPATARQVKGIEALSDQVAFTGWAVCSNGSVVVHLGTGEVLAQATIPVAVLREFTDAVRAALPGVVFFALYDAGRHYAAEPGYQTLTRYSDHKRDPAEFPLHDLAELTATPANKLAFRHPELTPEEMLPRVHALAVPGVTLSHSGAPFLELTGEGVSKAWGLERLRQHLGVDADRTIAFGDQLNDLEMLGWAHHAVAMPHAPAEVRAVADEIAPGNDEDGVATVLDRLFPGPVASALGEAHGLGAPVREPG